MQAKKDQKRRMFLYGLLLFTIVSIIIVRSENSKEKRFQENIAKEIIRFHIVANSDSKEDQELKMRIKDKVVNCLQNSLQDAGNINEARKKITMELTNIETLAAGLMKKNGFSYSVKAKLTKCNFPIKKYGDMIFPAGKYEALRIEIGQAAGKNWWCVMFPTLCFVDGTYSVVPKNSKKELQEILTEEEYESLLDESKDKITVKFKLVDLWKRLWS